MVIKIKTDSFEMSCIKFGCGSKNLVIIPGLSIKPVCETASSVENQYRIFSEDYTIYVPDRIDDVPQSYSIEQMAEDYVTAIMSLGLNDIYLFGVSQGGMIAQYISAFYPSLVKSLVIGSSASETNECNGQILDKWISLAAAGDVTGLYKNMIDNLYTTETIKKFDKLITVLASGLTSNDLYRFIVLASACKDFTFTNILGKIACPVLIIAAGNDKVVTTEASKIISDKLNCPLYIYEGYGHAVYDEAPDYTKRIFNFFSDK